MHVNSLIAYQEELKNLTGRKLKVYGYMIQHPEPATDRDIKDSLFGESADMNTVRPRISDLIVEGWIIETGKVKSKLTKRANRLVRALTADERFEIEEKRLAENIGGQEELNFDKPQKKMFDSVEEIMDYILTEMVESINPAIASECSGDIFCYYCSNSIEDGEDHDINCIWTIAKDYCDKKMEEGAA